MLLISLPLGTTNTITIAVDFYPLEIDTLNKLVVFGIAVSGLAILIKPWIKRRQKMVCSKPKCIVLLILILAKL